MVSVKMSYYQTNSSVVWDPYTQKDILAIESVQDLCIITTLHMQVSQICTWSYHDV